MSDRKAPPAEDWHEWQQAKMAMAAEADRRHSLLEAMRVHQGHGQKRIEVSRVALVA
jgi:hypothetical protein